MEKKITLTKSEYDDMVDYMERLQETLDVVSDTETVQKLNESLKRIDSGEYLSKEEMS
jgi:hypothetical protein